MLHAITRREFIDGAAVTVAGSLLPHAAAHSKAVARPEPGAAGLDPVLRCTLVCL
jgi:hypothetical protein